MVTQLRLPIDKPLWTRGACAFGEEEPDWWGPHHCSKCNASVEEASRWCEQEIAAGRYDENLYTPLEAKAARKRGTYHGVLTKLRTGELFICAWCNTLQPAAHACWSQEESRG